MKTILTLGSALALAIGVAAGATTSTMAPAPATTSTSPATIQDGPVAVIISVEGTVQVESGGAAPAPAGAGTRLSAGDRVLPSSGSSAVLIGRGGERTEVSGAYTVAAPEGATDDDDMFSRTVQVLGQVATASTEDLMDRQGMIRPIPGEPVLVAPRNQLTVLSPRPDFAWQGVEGATGYTLQIRTPGSSPVRFQDIVDTTWSYPESEPALEPGTEYWWTVAPTGSGRATREQRFSVLDEEEQEALAADLEALSRIGLDPAGDGAFLAAVLYRDAGLYYAAEAALEALEAAGDVLGPDGYLLLGEIRAEMGDAEGAGKAFDRADEMRP